MENETEWASWMSLGVGGGCGGWPLLTLLLAKIETIEFWKLATMDLDIGLTTYLILSPYISNKA